MNLLTTKLLQHPIAAVTSQKLAAASCLPELADAFERMLPQSSYLAAATSLGIEHHIKLTAELQPACLDSQNSAARIRQALAKPWRPGRVPQTMDDRRDIILKRG